MIIPKIFSGTKLIAAQSMRSDILLERNDVFKDQKDFFQKIGVKHEQLASSKQAHGDKVLVTDFPIRADGFDAIITNTPDVFATVSIADCAPILIFDPSNKVVAAVHAGWRGTVKEIVKKTLQTMKEKYGTAGINCLAFIGACISATAFEVGEEVAEQFDKRVTYFEKNTSRYFVDIKKANFYQLLDCGLTPQNIEISQYCTVFNNDLFYSYRKEKGKTGRMLAIIGMKNE